MQQSWKNKGSLNKESMKKEEIEALFMNYEDAVCMIDNRECWSARDLQELLGYTLWQNFTNVINTAKDACLKLPILFVKWQWI